MIEVAFAIFVCMTFALGVFLIILGIEENVPASAIIGLSILLFFGTWTYLYVASEKEYDAPVKFKIVETETCQFALHKNECVNLNERFGQKFDSDEVELVQLKAKYYYGIKPSHYSWELPNEL